MLSIFIDRSLCVMVCFDRLLSRESDYMDAALLSTMAVLCRDTITSFVIPQNITVSFLSCLLFSRPSLNSLLN